MQGDVFVDGGVDEMVHHEPCDACVFPSAAYGDVGHVSRGCHEGTANDDAFVQGDDGEIGVLELLRNVDRGPERLAQQDIDLV